MGWTPPATILPSMTVETSPGNFQFWFFLKTAVDPARARRLGEHIRNAVNSDHDTGKPIFVELKSRAGVASKVQKQVRLEMLPAGAAWWMARSARAALMALHLSGVVFRRQWKPPRLKPWEGPFADPNERLPQAPDVAAQRTAARRRSRERQRAREAAKRVAESDDAAGGDIAA
jgi:hypothetical protein